MTAGFLMDQYACGIIPRVGMKQAGAEMGLWLVLAEMRLVQDKSWIFMRSGAHRLNNGPDPIDGACLFISCDKPVANESVHLVYGCRR